MLPTITTTERADVARRVANALVSLDGDSSGTYYSLATADAPTLDTLKSDGMLFDNNDKCVDSNRNLSRRIQVMVGTCSLPRNLGCSSYHRLHQAAGITRDWPDARGVFVSTNNTLMAWCNQESHLRLVTLRRSGDLRGAYEQLASVCVLVTVKLREA